ncbi:MAG: DUF1616 domain-containing protein [Candidatus Bathyarchaeota archaeon]|nr:DUF1616 domain-containing protein [Candidatus Bathyarchaeota archaeon]
MNFGDVKLVYVASCFVLGLLILSPALVEIVSFPVGERFSELWLLGRGGLAEDYPFVVSEGVAYKIFLGVSNHLGGSSYYRVLVKFRSEFEPLPNSTVGSPSPLEPVFQYDLFLGDNETWERELNFSFSDVLFDGFTCRVSDILIENYAVGVDKVVVWNETGKGFYYQLFFELWVYNSTFSGFQFHNRWVGLWLNMSKPLQG